MSATSGVNVLRYSALCFGVLYGFYHQRTITSSQRSAAAQHEYEHKQKLIAEAKKAYAKSKQPASASATQSGGLNQDPNDPSFDLGAYIEGFLGQKA
ncbi:ATP synthase E chain-domain-containing protein [Schizothecium vesticola]|uniref:ATP synthase F(0) complex subunit e, mitochondrial n=1 Tax=Schizothecium vesticola TaxID=314040 RepID=A0AA40K5K8_9PEZI|nr:ATP synthase E chain-domain-containing protein [Schizothecium vesticola]